MDFDLFTVRNNVVFGSLHLISKCDDKFLL